MTASQFLILKVHFNRGISRRESVNSPVQLSKFTREERRSKIHPTLPFQGQGGAGLGFVYRGVACKCSSGLLGQQQILMLIRIPLGLGIVITESQPSGLFKFTLGFRANHEYYSSLSVAQFA